MTLCEQAYEWHMVSLIFRAYWANYIREQQQQQPHLPLPIYHLIMSLRVFFLYSVVANPMMYSYASVGINRFVYLLFFFCSSPCHLVLSTNGQKIGFVVVIKR